MEQGNISELLTAVTIEYEEQFRQEKKEKASKDGNAGQVHAWSDTLY